ncbi:MAG TPA: efflux transporter periplasmic adaptor subunit, partial [Legionellales bacterium]|nr:efflux transporter periplasmic adaptor subunit [Legionellales bacterium]
MKNKWILILIILFGVILGFLIGRYLPVAKMTETSKSATKKEKKVKYWVAPMNPTYRRDKPGKSPMGMDLVP